MIGLNFPVIEFKGNDIVTSFSPDEFEMRWKRFLKTKWFDDELVIDSELNGYHIATADQGRGGQGIIWRRVRVERIPRGRPFKVSLGEVKQRILGIIDGNIDVWESAWDADIPKLKRDLQQTESLIEICELLRDQC